MCVSSQHREPEMGISAGYADQHDADTQVDVMGLMAWSARLPIVVCGRWEWRHVGSHNKVLVVASCGENSVSKRFGGLSPEIFHLSEPVRGAQLAEIRDAPMVGVLDHGAFPPTATCVGPTMMADQRGVAADGNRPAILKMDEVRQRTAENPNPAVSVRHGLAVKVVVSQCEIHGPRAARQCQELKVCAECRCR